MATSSGRVNWDGVYAVIMAGGSGTRFWPASRNDRPKQLLHLVGESSMLQATVHRLSGLVAADRMLVMTNARLVEAVARQLPQLARSAIIGEPCKRDTAPCIGLAAGWAAHRQPHATLVVMPSDHVIQDVSALTRAIELAVAMVEEQPGRLVTFGIRPSYPAESFGYIERGEPLSLPARESGAMSAYRVHCFHEKPPAERAREYLATGNYLWNSGIFVWKAKTIWDYLQQFEPSMAEQLAKIVARLDADDPADSALALAEFFPEIVGRSIDHAVMERATDVAVIEAPFDWDDVGSWQAIARLRGADELGNTVTGSHLGLATEGSIIDTHGDHLVVTVGVQNLIVVHTPDATLVADKNQEESIRRVVKLLEEKGWTHYL